MANSKSNGCHYALTAIGIGMLVLGIIMAVWNMVPGFGSNDKHPPSPGNGSKPGQEEGGEVKSKTFSVAYVLVGSGVVLLLLAICLSVRAKRKRQMSRNSPEASPLPQTQEEIHEDEDIPRYGIPSYEEVMGTGLATSEGTDFDRNARISMSLPSYESLTELDETTPTRISPKEGTSIEPQQSKRNSRREKGAKPLRVRRIKSEKLHLKDFRLNLSNKNALVQKIEPMTPPPQYDGKTIESTPPI